MKPHSSSSAYTRVTDRRDATPPLAAAAAGVASVVTDVTVASTTASVPALLPRRLLMTHASMTGSRSTSAGGAGDGGRVSSSSSAGGAAALLGAATCVSAGHYTATLSRAAATVVSDATSPVYRCGSRSNSSSGGENNDRSDDNVVNAAVHCAAPRTLDALACSTHADPAMFAREVLYSNTSNNNNNNNNNTVDARRASRCDSRSRRYEPGAAFDACSDGDGSDVSDRHRGRRRHGGCGTRTGESLSSSSSSDEAEWGVLRGGVCVPRECAHTPTKMTTSSTTATTRMASRVRQRATFVGGSGGASVCRDGVSGSSGGVGVGGSDAQSLRLRCDGLSRRHVVVGSSSGRRQRGNSGHRRRYSSNRSRSSSNSRSGRAAATDMASVAARDAAAATAASSSSSSWSQAHGDDDDVLSRKVCGRAAESPIPRGGVAKCTSSVCSSSNSSSRCGGGGCYNTNNKDNDDDKNTHADTHRYKADDDVDDDDSNDDDDDDDVAASLFIPDMVFRVSTMTSKPCMPCLDAAALPVGTRVWVVDEDDVETILKIHWNTLHRRVCNGRLSGCVVRHSGSMCLVSFRACDEGLDFCLTLPRACLSTTPIKPYESPCRGDDCALLLNNACYSNLGPRASCGGGGGSGGGSSVSESVVGDVTCGAGGYGDVCHTRCASDMCRGRNDSSAGNSSSSSSGSCSRQAPTPASGGGGGVVQRVYYEAMDDLVDDVAAAAAVADNDDGDGDGDALGRRCDVYDGGGGSGSGSGSCTRGHATAVAVQRSLDEAAQLVRDGHFARACVTLDRVVASVTRATRTAATSASAAMTTTTTIQGAQPDCAHACSDGSGVYVVDNDDDRATLVRALLLRSRAHLFLEREDAALADAHACVAHAPRSVRAHVAVARALGACGEFARAQQSLTTATRVASPHAAQAVAAVRELNDYMCALHDDVTTASTVAHASLRLTLDAYYRKRWRVCRALVAGEVLCSEASPTVVAPSLFATTQPRDYCAVCLARRDGGAARDGSDHCGCGGGERVSDDDGDGDANAPAPCCCHCVRAAASPSSRLSLPAQQQQSQLPGSHRSTSSSSSHSSSSSTAGSERGDACEASCLSPSARWCCSATCAAQARACDALVHRHRAGLARARELIASKAAVSIDRMPLEMGNVTLHLFFSVMATHHRLQAEAEAAATTTTTTTTTTTASSSLLMMALRQLHVFPLVTETVSRRLRDEVAVVYEVLTRRFTPRERAVYTGELFLALYVYVRAYFVCVDMPVTRTAATTATTLTATATTTAYVLPSLVGCVERARVVSVLGCGTTAIRHTSPLSPLPRATLSTAIAAAAARGGVNSSDHAATATATTTHNCVIQLDTSTAAAVAVTAPVCDVAVPRSTPSRLQLVAARAVAAGEKLLLPSFVVDLSDID